MTAIVVKAFNGLKPIVDPRLLDNSEAQVAKNVRLISGALAPLRAPTTLKATVLAAPATIFRYGSSATETNYWLEFDQDTDIMRSPVAGDQFDRLYWTNGANRPRYAPNSLILSGANYPGASYELGIPAPSTAIVITSFSPVVNYTTVTRDYLMTFYSPSTGKESIPGAVFSTQAVDGQTVAFTNITTNNLGDAAVTKKRLYRKVSGTYRRVTELDLAVTIYNDTATDASLAAAPTLPAGVGSAPVAPVRAPSVAAGTAVTTTAGVARDYIYTITNYAITIGDVTDYYSESAPSPVRTVTADNTQTVTIGGMVNNLSGQKFRVYRKDPGMTAYQLVAEVPASQTSVADVIASTTLGPVLNNTGGSSPSSTPTGSVNGSTATSAVKRVYMVTFMDASGNESGEGPASAVVNVVDGQTLVTISHSETIPAGVTKKRFYRQTVTLVGGILTLNDANWKLVGETTASTTSTTDVAPDSSLTTGLAPALQGLPPAPGTTPVTNATIPPKQVPESRTYVYTYVSAYGEEGPPAEASDIVDLDPEQPVTISMGGAPTGSFNITLKRIYRSSTVGSRAEFQFVAEIPVATTSYVDSVDQGDLGEVLPSTGWVAPPAGLKGLRLMANGAAVGFVGKTLYLSEPNLPHAWPYQYPIDDEIVAVGVFGQSVAVLTNSYPYLFQGIDPAAMASTKLQLPQACASKRSLGETGDGVIYASPDGLVAIGSNVGLITQTSISRQQWQQYNPSSMQSYLHDGRVAIFYTGLNGVRGVLMFDLSGQGALMTTSNINEAVGSAVTAGYQDAKTDTLYLALGSNIVRFDAGSNMSLTWRSKVYRLPSQQNFAVAQVRASAYPVTFSLVADGATVHTQTVASGDQFRLPSGFLSLDYEFEVSGSSTISEVLVATSAMELKAA
jgi:hypothetical protein